MGGCRRGNIAAREPSRCRSTIIVGGLVRSRLKLESVETTVDGDDGVVGG
jgi:hypothetical protein